MKTAPLHKPWYKCPTFWLGIPGFIFLVWLWAGSVRQHLEIKRIEYTVDALDFRSLSSSSGKLTMFRITHDNTILGLPTAPVTYHNIKIPYENKDSRLADRIKKSAFIAPIYIGKKYPDSNYDKALINFEFTIAYWFATTLYLIIWLTLFTLHRRRINKHLAKAATSATQTIEN